MVASPVGPTTLDYASADDRLAASRRIAVRLGAILFTAMLPVTLLVPALPDIGKRYEASEFWTHGFMWINMVGALLASPIIGRLADRHGQRKQIAAAALVIDGICLAAMEAMPSLGGLLAVRCVEGAAHILALSTLMAMGAAWAPPDRRGRMMGMIGASMMFGTACGTRLGGRIALLAPDLMFVVAGVISLLAAVLVWLLTEDPPRQQRTREKFHDILTLLRQDRRLIIPWIYAFKDRFSVGVIISTFVLFLNNVHELPAEERSKLLLMFLAPFACLVYFAGRLVDRVGRVWPLALASMAFGVIFAAYGYVSLSELKWLMVVSGVVSALMFAPNLTVCADLAPEDRRGTAFTGFHVAGSLGFVCGPLMAGTLFTLLTEHSEYTNETAYRLTFLATGAIDVLCALATLPFLLRLKRSGVIR